MLRLGMFRRRKRTNHLVQLVLCKRVRFFQVVLRTVSKAIDDKDGMAFGTL